MERCAAGRLCSSYTGECVALLRALEWIANRGPEPEYLICTDSKSLQDALVTNSWRDQDPWLKKIKLLIQQIRSTITILWLPSHCEVLGNERADELAKEGTLLDQEKIPVVPSIVKAKIRARPWEIHHPPAKRMYGDRRKPRFDIEKNWPRSVRTLFSRLRSGHSMKLADYRFVIDKEEDDACQKCDMQKPETLEHVLCECTDLDEERERHFNGKVSVKQMITDPDTCRKLLSNRFEGLRMEEPPEPPPPPDRNAQNG